MKIGDIVQFLYEPKVISVVDNIYPNPLGDRIRVTWTSASGIPATGVCMANDWAPYSPSPTAMGDLKAWIPTDVSIHACDMKEYIGLTQSYSYCTICDKKVLA